MLAVLEVCLCKPAINKLKILGWGKLVYYKSMGETTKRGEAKFLKCSGEKQKGVGDTIFDLN